MFYALDFGGTNFRVVRTQLSGDGIIKLSQLKQSLLSASSAAHLSKGLLDSKATAALLFDFFSETCAQLISVECDMGARHKAGFTFSFPCNQQAINSAVLIEWTKGFETG